jgi:hypothetical protein
MVHVHLFRRLPADFGPEGAVRELAGSTLLLNPSGTRASVSTKLTVNAKRTSVESNVQVGLLPEAGSKFGERLRLLIMQRFL